MDMLRCEILACLCDMESITVHAGPSALFMQKVAGQNPHQLQANSQTSPVEGAGIDDCEQHVPISNFPVWPISTVGDTR